MRFGAREVLRGVDLRVSAGEIVGVVGDSGSGKTTLLRAIAGLVKPAGSVRFDGRELTALSERRRRAFRREGALQLVFQDPLRALDPAMRVEAIVNEGPAIRGTARREEAAHALTLAGLDPELLGRVPRDLSGGQRQRVAVARALVMRPRLMLLDEPVPALDAGARGALLRTLADVRDELGTALVIVSHDLASLSAVADRLVTLRHGLVVESERVSVLR